MQKKDKESSSQKLLAPTPQTSKKSLFATKIMFNNIENHKSISLENLWYFFKGLLQGSKVLKASIFGIMPSLNKGDVTITNSFLAYDKSIYLTPMVTIKRLTKVYIGHLVLFLLERLTKINSYCEFDQYVLRLVQRKRSGKHLPS